MAFDFIDTFVATAASALVGHTPDVGPVWVGDTTHMYPPSDIRQTGDGYSYNLAPSTGTSSLILAPGTFAGTTHQVEGDFRFRTDPGSAHTSGIPLYTPADASADCRFYWSAGLWFLTGPGAGPFNSAFALPSADTRVSVRISTTDGASPVIMAEVSLDHRQTWATLFGGAKTFSGNTHPFAPGIWYDGLSTPTTGVQVGNLRVAQTAIVPTLAVSPTTATVGTPLTLTLTGTGPDWLPGTPGAPGFTVSGGTGPALSVQSITTFKNATATLNPGSTAGTLTITDPTGGTATVTVSAASAPATSLTLTATSTAGTVGTGIVVTASLDNPATSVIVFNTTNSASGASSSPSSLTYAIGDRVKTFTVNATANCVDTVGGTAQ